MNNRIVRTILGVAGGVVAGGIVLFILEMLSPYKPASDVDMANKEALAAFIHSMPVSAWIYQLLACFISGAVGGMVANLISRPLSAPALTAGFGLMIANIMNFFAFPHPTWYMIASTLVFPLGAWIGARVLARLNG
jgi:hypothetical protein